MRIACHRQRPRAGTVLGLLFALLMIVLSPVSVSASQQTNPPVDRPPSGSFSALVASKTLVQQSGSNLFSPVEWTFHKTADGLHPNAMEQQILWLMNRARTDPAGEATWLSATTEADVARAREFFKIDMKMLSGEFTHYSVKPPAAFDVRLYRAALAHSKDLIIRNSQDHVGQYDRVVENGFECEGGSGYFFRGNVFSFAENGMNTHAAWNIDWGGPQGGMQKDRGHRMGVMSVDGDLTNAGIAMIYEEDPETIVGPYVTTANYCHAAQKDNQFNRFIVGTVWKDRDLDRIYDPGEGIGGVRVHPKGSRFFAITSESGGYSLPIIQPGHYRVVFSGVVNGMRHVDVHQESVLVDYVEETLIGLDQTFSYTTGGSIFQSTVTR